MLLLFLLLSFATLRSAITLQGISRRLPVLLLFLLLSFATLRSAYTQQSNTLFLMHPVPQSNQLNPAVQPGCKYYIGVPALTTMHFNYSNSSFVYNELVSGSRLELDAVFSSLYRRNMLSVEASAHLFSAGYKSGHNYYTFSVADHMHTHLSYPRDLAGFLLYGNALYVGEVLRINDTRLNAAYYREYSVGWSQEHDRYTTWGMRGKLLFGKTNIYTGASQLLLGTDIETFDLSMQGSLALNGSFPVVLEIDDAGLIYDAVVPEPDYRAMLMNRRNPGLAADFGVVYQYSDDIKLSAGLLDIGLILWTDEPYRLRGGIDFEYSGASNEADFSLSGYYRDLSDSIAYNVLYGVSRGTYVSALPAQLFVGGSYRWGRNTDLGFVLRNVLVNRRVVSSFTTSVGTQLDDRFMATASWSLINNSFMNFGAGLAYTGMGMQVYAVSDNVAGLFRPLDSRTINLRVGMNLMFGCPQNYYRNRGAKRSMVPCPKGLSLSGRRR